MDIKELTNEMNTFVTAKGWYSEDSKRQQTPRNLSISLSLETAEVLEHFQWGENVKDMEAFKNELADVALYLFQLASITGVDLETAILQKLKINYSRQWDTPKKGSES